MKRRIKALALLLAALLPATAWALEFRSVAVPRAILYDAPSAQAKKQFIVTQYYPVEVIVNLGGWLKVRDVKGGLAWIEASQLTEKRTVLVTAAEARVYDKPAADGRLVFRVARHVALELLEAPAAGWAKVRHRDGLVGYIQSTEVWGL